MPINPYPGGSNQQLYETPRSNRGPIYALLALGVLLVFGWVIMSAVKTRAATGILSISASDKAADIYIYTAGTAPKKLGQGSAKSRLAPGVYDVGARTSSGESRKVITITKGAVTEASVDIQGTVPQGSILPAKAKDMHVAGETLYYLDQDESVMRSYRLGDFYSRPYKATESHIQSVAWVSPTNYFKRVKDQWLVGGSENKLFNLSNEVGGTDSASFNPSGGSAFLTFTGSVTKATGPGAPHTRLGSYESDNGRTAIAPDGQVLAYTPRPKNFGEKEDSRLFGQNEETVLAKELSGIDNVVWAPGSSRFSYNDTSGAYIYDIPSKSSTRILAGEPDNPLSFTWTNDSTVMYGHDKRVWAFSVDDTTSRKLSDIAGDLNDKHPFVRSADGVHYFYATSRDAKDKGGQTYQLIPGYLSLSADDQQIARAALDKNAGVPHPELKGFDAIKSYGATDDQIDNVTYAIGVFAQKSGVEPSRIEMTNMGVVTQNRDQLIDSMPFTLKLDDKTYKATIEYSLFTKSRIILTDNSGRVVYDSGMLNSVE